MNKKAEGRISTFVITIVLALGVMVLVANLTASFTNQAEYNVKNASSLDEFETIFTNDLQKNVTDDLLNSQNAENQTWPDTVKDKFQSWFESSLVIRAWNTLKIFPKMIGVTTKSVTTAVDESGLSIPPITRTIILILIGLTIVLLIVKAIWEKKI